jgi:hypothetical protein
MSEKRFVQIKTNAIGQGSVHIDGVEVRGVSAVEFRVAAGKATELVLTFPAVEIEIESSIEAEKIKAV